MIAPFPVQIISRSLPYCNGPSAVPQGKMNQPHLKAPADFDTVELSNTLWPALWHCNKEVGMAWFDDALDEDRLTRCEKKAAEIRKLLLGTLLLAKDMWGNIAEREAAGIEVLRAVEQAEEDFVNSALIDRFEKIEDLLDVILKRAKAIFLLMEYISKNEQT
jgi:hypothetical protein